MGDGIRGDPGHMAVPMLYFGTQHPPLRESQSGSGNIPRVESFDARTEPVVGVYHSLSTLAYRLKTESAGEQATLTMAAAALAAATTAEKVTRPAAMAPSPENGILPHFEGAGGFADFSPLLEATFGM